MKKLLLIFLMITLGLSACGAPDAAPSNTPTLAPPADTATLIPPTDTPSPAPTETALPTATFTLTPEPTATETLTPSPVPTYAILRGKINVERASCRYGPGATYLYLYGLVQGATQDVIGRTNTGAWLLTQSRGDTKQCWVKADLMELNGDVMSVEVVYPGKYNIPQSNQGYLPPWDVAATRTGNQVTITWKSEALRAGDEEDANMQIYIVEVWACQNGQVTFTPIGTNFAQVTVTDETGCSEPSHGRVYFQEKHGYAGPSEIPWP